MFVYTRSGDTRLFEFDQNGAFVREIGQGLYGFEFAHAVRVDRDDNIWAVDEGTNMVIKFNPEGRVAMVIGRRPEAVDGSSRPAAGTPPPAPEPYVFSRPTDVGWDAAGNIFVTDGYGNSRVVKFDKNGRFLKEAGTRGDEPGQFNLPHTMAMDAQGNVYVGDRSNARVQVFDNDLNVKAIYDNVGNPWAVCISPGPHQYLFVSNSIPDNGLAQYTRHHRRDLQDGARRHDRRAIRQGRGNSSASSAPCTRSTAAIPTSCSCRKSPRGVSRKSCSGPRHGRRVGANSSETHCCLPHSTVLVAEPEHDFLDTPRGVVPTRQLAGLRQSIWCTLLNSLKRGRLAELPSTVPSSSIL